MDGAFNPEEGKFYSAEELGLHNEPKPSSSPSSFKPEEGKFYSAEDLGISEPKSSTTPQPSTSDREYETRVEKYMPEARKVLAPKLSSDYVPGVKQAYAATMAGLGFGEGENFSERYQNQRAKQDAYRRAKEQDEEQRVRAQMEAAKAAYSNQSGIGQSAQSAASGFFNLPVIGPVGQKIASAGTAAFQGSEEGKTYDERYLNNLAKIEAQNRLYAEKNPISNFIGSVAQAPLLPGNAAQTLPELMGVGAGLGAAQAAGKGENPITEAGIGAAGGALGRGLGFGAEYAGIGAKKLGNLAKNIISPVSRGEKSGIETFGQKYLDELARAPRDANGNITDPRFITPDVAAKQQLIGQETMGTDIGGGALAREARVQAIQHPEFESQLKGELLERQAQQKEDVGNMFHTLYGEKMDPIELIQKAKDTAREVNAPNYQETFSHPEAQNVWNDRLNQLTKSPEVRSLMSEAKNDLDWKRIKNGEEPIPTPLIQQNSTGKPEPQIPTSLEFWDALKRAAQEKSRSPDAPRRYTEIGQEIKEALGPKYLGDLGQKYHETLDTARKFFGQDNAFEGGQQLTKNISSIKRADLERQRATMTPEQLDQMEKGMASEMLYKVTSSTNPNAVTKMLDSPNVKNAFRELAPPDRANKIEAMLRIENIKNANRNSILNQSKTATNHRDLAQKFIHSPLGVAIIGGGGLEGLDWISGHITPFDYAQKAALAGAAAFIKHRYNKFSSSEAHAIQNLLLSKNPEEWQKAIDSVTSSPKGMDLLRKIDRGMSKSTAPVYQFMKNYAAPTYDQDDQNREGRKSGGRLSKKMHIHPGEIDLFERLMQSRRDHKKDTKPTLNKHDNEIASSLQHTQQQVTHADPIYS